MTPASVDLDHPSILVFGHDVPLVARELFDRATISGVLGEARDTSPLSINTSYKPIADLSKQFLAVISPEQLVDDMSEYMTVKLTNSSSFTKKPALAMKAKFSMGGFRLVCLGFSRGDRPRKLEL